MNNRYLFRLRDKKARFLSDCENYLKFHPEDMNSWYYPMDPIVSIGLNDICNTHWDILFEATGEQDLLIKSNYALIGMYFEAVMEQSLQMCRDLSVLDDPYNWTMEFLNNS